MDTGDSIEHCCGCLTPSKTTGRLIKIENIKKFPALSSQKGAYRINALEDNGAFYTTEGNEVTPKDFQSAGYKYVWPKSGDTVTITKSGVSLISDTAKSEFACEADADMTPPPSIPEFQPGGPKYYLKKDECGFIRSHSGYGSIKYGPNEYRRWNFAHDPKSPCNKFTIEFKNKFDIVMKYGSPQCYGDVFYFKDSAGGVARICGQKAPPKFSTTKPEFLAIFYSDIDDTEVGWGAIAIICSEC